MRHGCGEIRCNYVITHHRCEKGSRIAHRPTVLPCASALLCPRHEAVLSLASPSLAAMPAARRVCLRACAPAQRRPGWLAHRAARDGRRVQRTRGVERVQLHDGREDHPGRVCAPARGHARMPPGRLAAAQGQVTRSSVVLQPTGEHVGKLRAELCGERRALQQRPVQQRAYQHAQHRLWAHSVAPLLARACA